MFNASNYHNSFLCFEECDYELQMYCVDPRYMVAIRADLLCYEVNITMWHLYVIYLSFAVCNLKSVLFQAIEVLLKIAR